MSGNGAEYIVEGEFVGQVDLGVQGEELEDVGVGAVGAWGLGAGPAAAAKGAPTVFKPGDRARISEAVLGNAAERGVDAEGQRMGGGFLQGNVGILDDEHEFRCFARRRCPGEGG